MTETGSCAGLCAGARLLAQALFLGSQNRTRNPDRLNSSDMAQPGAPQHIQAMLLFQALPNVAVPAGVWLFLNHLSIIFLHHCKAQSLKPTVKNLISPFFYGRILELFLCPSIVDLITPSAEVDGNHVLDS